MIKEILSLGSDRVEWSDVASDYTPLMLACDKEGNKDIVEMLLRAGAKVNGGVLCDSTPLAIAAHKGFNEIVGILLKFGADVNKVDSFVMTPLHLASELGDIQICVKC